MQLLYHPRTLKFLRKIPKKEAGRIISTLEKLKVAPQGANLNIKRLINSKGSWRIRIGNIRAIYEIDSGKKIIYILDLDFRGNIY